MVWIVTYMGVYDPEIILYNHAHACEYDLSYYVGKKWFVVVCDFIVIKCFHAETETVLE